VGNAIVVWRKCPCNILPPKKARADADKKKARLAADVDRLRARLQNLADQAVAKQDEIRLQLQKQKMEKELDIQVGCLESCWFSDNTVVLDMDDAQEHCTGYPNLKFSSRRTTATLWWTIWSATEWVLLPVNEPVTCGVAES
jgi:hypothetical protein